MTINLLFLYQDPYGGVLSLATHLCLLLRQHGHVARIVSLASKNGSKYTNLVEHLTITKETFYTLDGTNVIAHQHYNKGDADCIELTDHFLSVGTPIIIPDHRALHDNIASSGARCAVITPGYKPEWSGELISLPIPYVRFAGHIYLQEYHVVSATRVAKEKNVEIILKANELLPKHKRIHIVGKMDMRYVNFQLRKLYPNWRDYYLGTHESLNCSAVQCYSLGRFAVDLSHLPFQEGRAQYSFLEAMDAGAPLIINKKWCVPGDIMDHNVSCVGVDTAEELASVIEAEPPSFHRRCEEILQLHYDCGEDWLEWMYG